MKFDFLPDVYKKALIKVDCDALYEIRMRVSYPVLARVMDRQFYLSDFGLTMSIDDAIICTFEHISETLNRVTEYSVYACNEKIKQGYLTTKDGVRIGIAGECVNDKNGVVTIKNVSSLNLRIPHEIHNCSNKIFQNILVDDRVFNTLLISPPTCGKTTILKDLARKLDSKNIGSILIIDERSEFSSVNGKNIDSIKYADKYYAFEYGIRSMAPKFVITDELATADDWRYAKVASSSGVNIITSCHGYNLDDVIRKDYFIDKVFNRYVVLESKGQAGVVKSIYNEDFTQL